ncbi:MAG: hypothetical protein E3J21_02490 [Anaerolineales bacterium]|nr:MAG: hypothetical protein E3J21_02490 [Anaerolineales bacterium]
MEELSVSDRTDVLLKALDNQIKSIEQGENREQQFFQWSTSLLLAAFGAVVALSDRSSALPFPILVKSLATVLVVVPVLLSIIWIFRRSRRSVRNAEAIERIEKALHLFKGEYYGTDSPYPEEWEGKLVESRLRRKTPVYYSLVMALMTICVVAVIWLVL